MPSKVAPSTAMDQSVGFALIGVEINHPATVISVTTMIPSQNLR